MLSDKNKEKGAAGRSLVHSLLGLVLYAIAALEALYPSRRIHDTPLTGEEGVTLAAYLHFQQLFGGTCSKSVATGTSHFGIRIIFGMNLRFHQFSA
jgi:hypothetical protein